MFELIYDFINKQFVCGKCPKPMKIQYLNAELIVDCYTILVQIS